MNLNTFKNEKQEKLINLDKYDDEDLTVIFGEIFPNASENMKDFLMAQHKILSAPKNHGKKGIGPICHKNLL